MIIYKKHRIYAESDKIRPTDCQVVMSDGRPILILDEEDYE